MAKKPAKKKPSQKTVETLRHEEATRKNIPTAEHQSVMHDAGMHPIRVAYERRNRDLDPQLVWRGKDVQNWSDLVVHAPALYIQEKVHPKVLIDDLLRESQRQSNSSEQASLDLFADFNGIPEGVDRTEFYQHDANWSNRMVLGDSLQVMASLVEREGLRGQVQCIYIDPPYGITFNSNFQWSTTSRDVKDGRPDHMTREPEQVKAFRDTWRDGMHSYLTNLRDRLSVARDLLTDSGSVFVQIGDENVHRVRAVMDEVFGAGNFYSLIYYRALTPLGSRGISNVYDYVIWYAKDKSQVKYRNLQLERPMEDEPEFCFRDDGSGWFEKLSEAPTDPAGVFKRSDLKSAGYTPTCVYDFEFLGQRVVPRGRKSWRTNRAGMDRLAKAQRLFNLGQSTYFKQYFNDSPMRQMENTWTDTAAGFSDTKVYVVQTHDKIITRCVLMTTDPGDLVLDPTCGSGTTAYVAEQWGRRWVTIDTSRVALALARARVMGARFPYYLLSDSREGQLKEAEARRAAPSDAPVFGRIRQGFTLQRVPRVTLGAIANNAEIDVIWERYEETLEPVRRQLNSAVGETWQEWEIPRRAGDTWPSPARRLHTQWWQQRIARQKEMDASISAKAEFEYLYDKPYEDRKTVRVSGPFTVESLSPHRVLALDEDDRMIDPVEQVSDGTRDEQDFVTMILENLRTAGVQQAHKEDKIIFTSLTPWPGDLVCAEGRYIESDQERTERRAAIFVGPEFGTVSRPDLVAAAREAGDAGFDVLITCAFNYDAHSSEFNRLGRIPVLKARMNADLHMADDLRNTGKGNLFVIFGEPDIELLDAEDGQVRVRIRGVDVFHPNTGEVRSDGPEGIACWFVDTNYNMESFFVRHAYFLGANDPYSALKTTLKAEINEDAWATLHSDTSRPFDRPESGRIAVKVINHLGDEVMKVFRL